MTDYELQRPARRCAATEREFAPGEEFFSALMAEGAELRRYDYSTDAWKGPPPGAIGWWKSHAPGRETRRPYWAPHDILLNFFDQLTEQSDRQDMRYVLALLLVRRRVMRLEEERRDAEGREVLVLYCPRRETTHEVSAVAPEPAKVEEIQQELARLLEG
jgi:hypothetical protein